MVDPAPRADIAPCAENIPGCLSSPSSRPFCTATNLTLEEIIPSGYRGREFRIENEGLGDFFNFFFLFKSALIALGL